MDICLGTASFMENTFAFLTIFLKNVNVLGTNDVKFGPFGVHFGHWYSHKTPMNNHWGLIRGEQRNLNIFISQIEKICEKLQFITKSCQIWPFGVNFRPTLALQSPKGVILWHGRVWKLTIKIFSVIFWDNVPYGTHNKAFLA